MRNILTIALILLAFAAFADEALASYRPPTGPAGLYPYGGGVFHDIVVMEVEGQDRHFIDPWKNVNTWEKTDSQGKDYWIAQYLSGGIEYRIVYRLKSIGFPSIIEYKRTVEAKHPETGEWHEVPGHSPRFGEWRQR